MYTKLGKFLEAEQDFMNAISIHKQMGERVGLGMAYHKLGALYILMDQYDKAKEILTEGMRFSKEYNIVIYNIL